MESTLRRRFPSSRFWDVIRPLTVKGPESQVDHSGDDEASASSGHESRLSQVDHSGDDEASTSSGHESRLSEVANSGDDEASNSSGHEFRLSQVDNSGDDEASTSSGHIMRSNQGRPGLRVPEGSSSYGDHYITVSSSHSAVCRPSNKFSKEYLHLQALIRDVLSRVELERKQYLTLPKVMVGLDGLITKVVGEHLRIHAAVGVCGMGGLGKTTLAKRIFNQVCVNFEFTCFAEEINKLTGPKAEIKGKVWKQMRNRGGVPVQKADRDYADEWYRVKGRSLLVIFDDVDNDQHMELLREIANDNGCVDSRFIVTSRNSQLLREGYGDDIHIIHLEHLGNEDAKKLLTAYAFPGKQEPPDSLRNIVQEVIDGCAGLPLTLEILGKHLRCTPAERWAEIPSALRRCTNDFANLEQSVWARLQLSYDGLPGDEAKNMFLDIASFFALNDGGDWLNHFTGDAVMAWSSIYKNVLDHLQILVDRSLVTVLHYENPQDHKTRTEFYMHEHLRRMGQKIAREKGRSFDLSRIRSSAKSTSEDQNLYRWYDAEVVSQGSQEELGTIVALCIEVRTKSCSFCTMHELLPKLAAIQFMDLRVYSTNRCEQCRNQQLPLPSTLVLLRLVGFDDALTVQAGGNAASDVSGALSLSTCASLVKLELQGCEILGELSSLQQLRVLMIRYGRGAGNWAMSLGELRRLEHLELFGINEPLELPVSFGDLTALQYLKIESCQVRSVPVSSTDWKNLRFWRGIEEPSQLGRLTISRRWTGH
ncbi:hypothetical protein R1sor_012748 [Riccia sorocarpa]|uniref:NB-ARC domain-containing protein n=1 Tax=Riccia sorocarpa TaxID=122646 RepID=A0ABD3I4M3_9MARC